MVTDHGGSDPLGPEWTARVELQDRAARTYVGWVFTQGGSAMYERSTGGTWRRSPGEAPAEPELNEVFESLVMHAIARRVHTLRGRWANGRLTLLDNAG